MLRLDKEYIASLLYRHRDESGNGLYLAHFGFGKDEPFPLFMTKSQSIQTAVERFLFHAVDQVEQEKSLMLLLSTTPWVPETNHDYIHSRLKFLLPQNIDVHVIDVSKFKTSTSALLRAVMKSCGIEHFARHDSGNLKKLRSHILYQWSEYKKKQYFILYRSDNLSFPQISFLKNLTVSDHLTTLPLTYFALEGTLETLFAVRDIRKEPIADHVYGSYTIFHRGSIKTMSENISEKLGKSLTELVTESIFKELFYVCGDGALFALFHSVLARMHSRRVKKLEKQKDTQEIFSELQKENDEFIARSPEYNAKLEKKDYIFPPELLRQDPSITEARRFFRWMGWEE